MADKSLLNKLGVKLDDDGEIDCQASDECHMIIEYLMDQIEKANDYYEKAERTGDEIGMAMIAVQQNLLLRTAEAIHAGAHLF